MINIDFVSSKWLHDKISKVLRHDKKSLQMLIKYYCRTRQRTRSRQYPKDPSSYMSGVILTNTLRHGAKTFQNNYLNNLFLDNFISTQYITIIYKNTIIIKMNQNRIIKHKVIYILLKIWIYINITSNTLW